LIGFEKAKVNQPFGQYSMLMHMFLFKGSSYFEKNMELTRERMEKCYLFSCGIWICPRIERMPVFAGLIDTLLPN
jgi:hypothetical protein